MSIEYYDHHAKEFIQATFQTDMSPLLEQFVSYLPPKARILDVGCGSGRDSLWLMDRGYDVYAHDGSPAMVDHCKSFMGDRVSQSTFEEFQTDRTFQGVWACASLLHVKREILPDMVQKYANFLEEGGIFFASFKRRDEDHEKDGRCFTNMTVESLTELINQCSDLEILNILLTRDVREGRDEEIWVSVFARKKS